MQTEAQKINFVTGAYVDLIARSLGKARRSVVPEVAISHISVLAGSLLLRSFHFDLSTMKPGSVLLSSEANEQGPLLIDVLFKSLEQYGLTANPTQLQEMYNKSPTDMNVVEITGLLQHEAINIKNDSELNDQSAAIAASQATAFIIKECVPSINLEQACAIAMLGFVTGAKTVPATLSHPTKKPWYQFW